MLPDDIPVRRMVGYLPERLDFDRWMTAIEFLSFHHALADQPEAARMSDIEHLLTLVQLDSSAWKTRIGKYSRGMLQRIGLAQALIGQPKYLLLDEPASGVDPAGVVLFRSILRDLKSKGVTIILNSHQLDQVEKICDKAAFVNKGKIETIEVLNQEERTEGIVVVKWKPASNAETIELWKKQIAEQSYGQVIESGNNYARFTTGSVDLTSQLVKYLVNQDIPVVHVSYEDVVLERLFLGGKNDEKSDN
jgi:ABC-2 type transport system ATP-binding protein